MLPFPAGGSFDPIVRALAEAASKDLGQAIVLMHKPGGGGVTGTAGIATMSEADGYTLAVMHNSVIRAPLVQKIAWDPRRDFTYVCRLFELVTGVCVAADAPWRTLPDLIADAKRRPGEISWGNVGAISANRITAERLARQAGVRFNMVPYKGGGEAFTALIGRHLDVYGDPGFGAQVQGGKVRLLATFTAQRMRRYPDVPTVRQYGYDYVIESPVGLVAPKGLDPKIGLRLQEAFRKASQDPVYQTQLELFDMGHGFADGEAYAAYARAQYDREVRMLAEIGFKPE
ncbi:tripartite tricarboxylate transporter substrate binding protein [Piscinibacter sakaiensis]|uniref:tripartite tricarboxylate transporter substrate binding protein n=1 Tax=Piscinibacter sakaiensis TaxID=1547922 RepID=UPI00372902AE